MQLVRGDDDLPALGETVSRVVGGSTYFVLHSEGAEDNPNMLHVYRPTADGQKADRQSPVGRVVVQTKWGWSYTPKLAIAFVTHRAFVSADNENVALFGLEGPNRENFLQWVQHPGPPNLGDDLLLQRANHNAMSWNVINSLLAKACENSAVKVCVGACCVVR